MNRVERLLFMLILSAGVLLPAALHAQAPDEPNQPASAGQPTDQKNQKKDDKKGNQSQRQLYKELATPYKKWLDCRFGRDWR